LPSIIYGCKKAWFFIIYLSSKFLINLEKESTMGIEKGLLDKMISNNFMGKRRLGRPLKYNIRNRGRAG